MNARSTQIRLSNIDTSIALTDSLSSSLGPRGADKMITDSKNKTIVTNDGATILKTLKGSNPIVRILTSLSQTQDKEVGDGTTTVVILAGAILKHMRPFVERGVHSSILCEALDEAKPVVVDAIKQLGIKVDILNKNSLTRVATTTLSSKVVSTVVEIADTAVDAVIAACGDMSRIKVIKKLGGGLEDITMVKGCVLDKPNMEVKKQCNIALLQYYLSPPQTYTDSKVILDKPELMDAVIKEERNYILNLCKKIKAAEIDLVVVQQSVLRQGVSDLARHFLNKMGVAVISDMDRKEFEFLRKNLNIRPISDLEFLEIGKNTEYIKSVDIDVDDEFLKILEGENVTVVVRGGDPLVLDEAERSLNDALWVVKTLYDDPHLIPGGGTIESAVSKALFNYAPTSKNSSILFEISRAFETIPFLLAANAGLNPVEIVNKLKKEGGGVNARIGTVSDMVEEEVVQPLKVSTTACSLALETAAMILMIDDILPSREPLRE